jgi:error-prone DNA polymerase
MDVFTPGLTGNTSPVPSAGYAELHCLSAFSFQRGASHPQELVQRAHELGYAALAITDECSMAGVVRAHQEAKEHGFKLIIGTEIRLEDGPKLVLLAPDHEAYTRLCELITRGRRRHTKGGYRLSRADVETCAKGVLALWPPAGDEDDHSEGDWVAATFPGRAWIALSLLREGDDSGRLARAQRLSAHLKLPCVATGDVHMHVRARRALQDLMTAIRVHRPLSDCGTALHTNGERHLRPMPALRELYPQAMLDESLAIAARCTFSMDSLRYQYPHELVPPGETASSHLRALTLAGMAQRWPQGVDDKVRLQIERELTLIAELKYEHFFLTVHDVVAWARTRGILCQGRGSSANSAVCYALGITAVDPARSQMLFERFLSKERNEPPDIDVDFEHQRREEVIQYIYGKYGRRRAALAATVISYRRRSAIRDTGRALGMAADVIDALSKSLVWWDAPDSLPQRLRELGLDPDSQRVRLWLRMIEELRGMPRHLSQHVGGFVISETPLSCLVPVENAAMPERTIIQWDKDDLETLGLLKVDVLALGMLSALRRALEMVSVQKGQPFALTDIPPDCGPTYAMIQRAETVGVFQIESRAQMSMLPRLRPENYYDLVIQVAIVRPGPIQGGMVHPYLKRRNGEEAVSYPSEALKDVLERTCGVPLFQEQVMQIAIVAADFTPGEADQVRRSMAAWKRHGGLEHFRDKLLTGMARNDYDPAFAEAIYQQVLGFGSYGFPESHAASFALLAYASSWLKCHHPAAFTAALINSLPMGFYGPAQLVREARRMGVEVRAVDVTSSDWDCTLELPDADKPALRLGLRVINGLSAEGAQRLLDARAQRDFTDIADLVHRARLNRHDREALAHADALAPLAGHRHRASWQALGSERLPGLLAGHAAAEPAPELPAPREAEEIVADYAATGLTLRRHPVALLRPRLRRLGVRSAQDIETLEDGCALRVAGLVINRQRPGTAHGTMFMTLEDETGAHNLIVWTDTFERYRHACLGSFLIVRGKLQKAEGVTHIVAHHVRDHSEWLGELEVGSRDFH